MNFRLIFVLNCSYCSKYVLLILLLELSNELAVSPEVEMEGEEGEGSGGTSPQKSCVLTSTPTPASRTVSAIATTRPSALVNPKVLYTILQRPEFLRYDIQLYRDIFC